MTSPGQAASLGLAAAQAALAAVLTAAAEFALTEGTARPSGSPVEVDVVGYARSGFDWEQVSSGLYQNDTAASWTLPDDTVVGGIAVLDATHGTLDDPLAWVELDTPFVFAGGQPLEIPVGGVLVQGYAEL